jgi:hypothetical protein
VPRVVNLAERKRLYDEAAFGKSINRRGRRGCREDNREIEREERIKRIE